MQDNDEKLGNERLLKMARGVAQGMDYLSTIGFVHRVRPLHLHYNWARFCNSEFNSILSGIILHKACHPNKLLVWERERPKPLMWPQPLPKWHPSSHHALRFSCGGHYVYVLTWNVCKVYVACSGLWALKFQPQKWFLSILLQHGAYTYIALQQLRWCTFR